MPRAKGTKRKRASNAKPAEQHKRQKCDKEVELNCDVLLLIFAKLNSATELCKLRCVCKTWNSCATSSFLWKKICIATFGPLPPSLLQISPFNPNNATTKIQQRKSTKAEEVEDNNISYFTLYKQFISSLPTVESVEVNAKNIDIGKVDLSKEQSFFEFRYNNNEKANNGDCDDSRKEFTVEDHKLAVTASFFLDTQNEDTIDLRNFTVTIGSFAATNEDYTPFRNRNNTTTDINAIDEKNKSSIDTLVFAIPFSRVCWSILHGYDKILYQVLQLQHLESNKSINDDDDEDDEAGDAATNSDDASNINKRFNVKKEFENGLTSEQLIVKYLSNEINIEKSGNIHAQPNRLSTWHGLGPLLKANKNKKNDYSSISVSSCLSPFIYFNLLESKEETASLNKCRRFGLSKREVIGNPSKQQNTNNVTNNNTRTSRRLTNKKMKAKEDYSKNNNFVKFFHWNVDNFNNTEACDDYDDLCLFSGNSKLGHVEWAPAFMNASHNWSYTIYHIFSLSTTITNRLIVLRQSNSGSGF